MNGTLYDFVNRSAEQRLLAPLRRSLLSHLHGDIVDVGAGTGANFQYYPAGSSVLALEPSASMAQRARKKMASSSARIQLEGSDDRYLDTIEPASVDVVVISLVLCSVVDPETTLRRARRLLKPNGSLILIEHVRADGAAGRVQDFLTPLWRHISGCHLNRDTGATAARAGFDTRTIEIKLIPGLNPAQKLIYGSMPLSLR